MQVPDDSDEMFSIALNAGVQLWRAGCWIRAALLAGVWATVAWAPVTEIPRAIAQLSVATAALLVAFAHVTEGGLDLLGRLPGTARLVDHLAAAFGRATVDASGLAEGLGALLATWLFVGWYPLVGLPAWVRSAGLVMSVGYSWDAVLQAVIDPGWYSVEYPPSRSMRVLRYAIPVIFSCIITFALWPWRAIDAQVPLLIRILLCTSPAVYYLVWAAFDVLLRSSVVSLRNSQARWSWDVWGDVHGSVKNTLVFLQQYVEEPDPDLAEIRSLARNALVVVDEFRRDLVGHTAKDSIEGSVGELWGSVLRALGSPRRVRCVLDTESERLQLSATDYQIARRVLPDLMSNAMRAGASAIHARCSVGGHPAEVRVEVVDDGAGLSAVDMSDPETSLRTLRARLRERKGDVEHMANARGGTTAVAYWRADSRHSLADAGLAR